MRSSCRKNAQEAHKSRPPPSALRDSARRADGLEPLRDKAKRQLPPYHCPPLPRRRRSNTLPEPSGAAGAGKPVVFRSFSGRCRDRFGSRSSSAICVFEFESRGFVSGGILKPPQPARVAAARTVALRQHRNSTSEIGLKPTARLEPPWRNTAALRSR